MLIVCPTCATAYQIEPAALGAAGRSVRCSHCKNTWFATPESVVEEAVRPLPRRPRPCASDPPPAPPPPPEAEDFDHGDRQRFLGRGRDAARRCRHDRRSRTALTAMDAPPLAPMDEAEPQSRPRRNSIRAPPDDIETIAARRARQAHAERKAKRTLLQRILSLPVLIVALAAILLGALQWRATVVRHFPQTASLFSMLGMPVNLRGLIFQDVKSRSEFHDGVMVLVVEGMIVNLTPQHARSAAPALRIAQRHRPRGLCLDRAAVEAHCSDRATGCRSAPGLPRRRRTGAT